MNATHEVSATHGAAAISRGSEIWNDQAIFASRSGRSCYVRTASDPSFETIVRSVLDRRCPETSDLRFGTAESSGYIVKRMSAFASPSLKCNGERVELTDRGAEGASAIAAWRKANHKAIEPKPAPPPTPTSKDQTDLASREPTQPTPSLENPSICPPIPLIGDEPRHCESILSAPGRVFFSLGDSEVGDIADAQRSLRTERAERVVVLGFASSSGSYEYNLLLSAKRANNLAFALQNSDENQELSVVGICAYGKQFAKCLESGTGGEADAMRAIVLPVK